MYWFSIALGGMSNRIIKWVLLHQRLFTFTNTDLVFPRTSFLEGTKGHFTKLRDSNQLLLGLFSIIAFLIFYHDWIVIFICENKAAASNMEPSGHALAFQDALTTLLAIFNNQMLLELRIKLRIPLHFVCSDSSDTMILSSICLFINSFLLFLVHLCYWAPLWLIIIKERLSKHFDIKVFFRSIFLK